MKDKKRVVASRLVEYPSLGIFGEMLRNFFMATNLPPMPTKFVILANISLNIVEHVTSSPLEELGVGSMRATPRTIKAAQLAFKMETDETFYAEVVKVMQSAAGIQSDVEFAKGTAAKYANTVETLSTVLADIWEMLETAFSDLNDLKDSEEK